MQILSRILRPKKKLKFQINSRKSFFYEKLYFCIKTWCSGLIIAKKLILRPKKGQNPIFKHFRFDALFSQSLLWLTYTSDFTPNRLKLIAIVKQKMLEKFVKLALMVWQICPKKWQGNQFLPPHPKLWLMLNEERVHSYFRDFVFWKSRGIEWFLLFGIHSFLFKKQLIRNQMHKCAKN